MLWCWVGSWRNQQSPKTLYLFSTQLNRTGTAIRKNIHFTLSIIVFIMDQLNVLYIAMSCSKNKLLSTLLPYPTGRMLYYFGSRRSVELCFYLLGHRGSHLHSALQCLESRCNSLQTYVEDTKSQHKQLTRAKIEKNIMIMTQPLPAYLMMQHFLMDPLPVSQHGPAPTLQLRVLHRSRVHLPKYAQRFLRLTAP